MTSGQKFKVVGATAAFAGVVLAGMFLTSPRGRAQDRGDGADSRIEQGFDIAATYLGGGRDFGPFPGPGPFPHIFSRNLTPDKTGRPEGGHSFAEFAQIIRTGVDMDHRHPTCTGAPTGSCLPPPFDGTRLQIMPWPTYEQMTDHDLRAIYEYLSAIPCIDTIVPGQPQLRNDCS